MYYCGLLKNTKVVEIFYSRNKPSKESHDKLYGFLFGGYRNKNKCIEVAKYQFPYATIRFYDARKKTHITSHNLYVIAGIV
jgi:hypothetical protein